MRTQPISLYVPVRTGPGSETSIFDVKSAAYTEEGALQRVRKQHPGAKVERVVHLSEIPDHHHLVHVSQFELLQRFAEQVRLASEDFSAEHEWSQALLTLYREARFLLSEAPKPEKEAASPCSESAHEPGPITAFEGPYAALELFAPCEIRMKGEVYPSAGHAFLAAKTESPLERSAIRAASSAGEAKRLAAQLTVRADFDSIKLQVMEGILRQKFSHASCRDALVSTGRAPLVFESRAGDLFWGVRGGKGENHLGRLMMQIRSDVMRTS